MSSTISRVLYWMVIYLVQVLPPSSSDLPKSTAGNRIALYSVLLQVGFTQPYMLPYRRWSLKPPFHPYQCRQTTLAVYFCCTSLGVASTGRYPALCPAKLGLSSPIVFPHSQARPSVLLTLGILSLLLLCVNKIIKKMQN